MQINAYFTFFILTLLFVNGIHGDPMDEDQSSSSSSSKKLKAAPFNTPFESSEHRELYEKASKNRQGIYNEGSRRIQEIQKIHPMFQEYDQSRLQELQEKAKNSAHAAERAKATPIVKPKNGH